MSENRIRIEKQLGKSINPNSIIKTNNVNEPEYLEIAGVDKYFGTDANGNAGVFDLPVVSGDPTEILYFDLNGDVYSDDKATRNPTDLDTKILRNYTTQIITPTNTFTGTGSDNLVVDSYQSGAIGKTYTITIDSALNFSGQLGTLATSAYTMGGTYSQTNFASKFTATIDGDSYIEINGYTGGTITSTTVHIYSSGGGVGTFISEGGGNITLGQLSSNPLVLNVGDNIYDNNNNLLFTVDAGMTVNSPLSFDIVIFKEDSIAIMGNTPITTEVAYVVSGSSQSFFASGVNVAFAITSGNPQGGFISFIYSYGGIALEALSYTGSINTFEQFTQATSGATGMASYVDLGINLVILTQIVGSIDYAEDLLFPSGTITASNDVRVDENCANTYTITDGANTVMFNPIATTNSFQFDSNNVSLRFTNIYGNIIGDYWVLTFPATPNVVETGFKTIKDFQLSGIPMNLDVSVLEAKGDDVQSVVGIVNTQPFGRQESSQPIMGKFYANNSNCLISIEDNKDIIITSFDSTNNKSLEYKLSNENGAFTWNVNNGTSSNSAYLSTEDFGIQKYPNTRDDSGVFTPENFFYSDNTGKFLSAPLSAIAGGVITGTYSDFQTLISNNDLKQGSFYLMTDYETIYDQPDYDNSGNIKSTLTLKVGAVEPILLFATSSNTFAKEVWSTIYPKDKLQYDISINTTFFSASPCKGRIVERIDEWNNRTDYDHRVVQFIRYNNGSGVYNVINDNGNTAQEFLTFGIGYNNGAFVVNNYIGDMWLYRDDYGFDLPNSVINTMNYCADNKTGSLFYFNTTQDLFYRNIIEDEFWLNIIANEFSMNYIGNDFHENIIGNFFNSNNIGASYSYHNIGDEFYSNVIYDNNNTNIFDTTQSINNKIFSSNIQNKDFTAETYMYNTDYEVKVAKASNGNVYAIYFNGSTDSINLIP